MHSPAAIPLLFKPATHFIQQLYTHLSSFLVDGTSPLELRAPARVHATLALRVPHDRPVLPGVLPLTETIGGLRNWDVAPSAWNTQAQHVLGSLESRNRPKSPE